MARASHTTEQEINLFEELFVRTLSVGAGWITLMSGVYFFWQFPSWLAWTSILIAIVIWIFSLRKIVPRLQFPITNSLTPFALVVVLADAVILGIAWVFRTDQAIISPWQVLPIAIFALYAIGSLFAILAWNKLQEPWRLALAILHSITAFGISACVYQLGFGFDPFVHEAATNYIVQHGAIEPKTPFYIGQYILIAGLHHVTGIAVGTLHNWLLPILASVLFPISFSFGWRHWTISEKPAPFWMMFILPYAYFTFTVPFNLAMLGLVICLLLIPLKGNMARNARWLLALASCTIHPLIGIPCVALVAAAEVGARYIAPLRVGMIAFFLTTFGLCGALFTYALGHGGSFTNVLHVDWYGILLTLFRPPFETLKIAPYWSVLYIGYAIWPWALTVCGFVGCWRMRKMVNGISLIPMGVAAGLFVSAILTAACLRYHNIIALEQFEFSFRLLAIMPWVLLPGLMGFFQETRLDAKRMILISIMMTAAWHVSYPQLNPVMHVYSPGVSVSDFLAVDTMERLADGKPYAALAPQLTSAAALREFGFERSIITPDGPNYPYAIPTGGYLYSRYLGLFDGSDTQTMIREALDYAGTPILFVVIPVSWDTKDELDHALAKIAAHSELVDDSLRVYEIERPK